MVAPHPVNMGDLSVVYSVIQKNCLLCNVMYDVLCQRGNWSHSFLVEYAKYAFMFYMKARTVWEKMYI